MAYCSDCGAEIKPTATFCTGCGKPVGCNAPTTSPAAENESFAKYLTQVAQPLQNVIREYIKDSLEPFLDNLKTKYNLTEDNVNDLTTEVLLILCHVQPMDNLKDDLIAEVGLSYETAVRIQRDLEKEVDAKIVPEVKRRSLSFEGQREEGSPPVPTAPVKESSGVLYEDYGCRVTRSALDIGGTSYPIRTVASLTAPMQESFELFGGFLLNGGLAVVGLMGILSFSPVWMVLGALAALLGGFNVRSQFRRPWFMFVNFTNGEKEMITRQSGGDIRKLYSSLKTALG